MFPHGTDEHQTQIIAEKTRSPNFNYKQTHELEIDEELCAFLLSNTLTVGIYGKKESKSSKSLKNKEAQSKSGAMHHDDFDFDNEH